MEKYLYSYKCTVYADTNVADTVAPSCNSTQFNYSMYQFNSVGGWLLAINLVH